jgi:enamine deaminase RidA (YjgF/YER057c/UK114 family)
MDAFAARLKELGVVLPEPPAPVASYVPFVEVGGLVHISGQVSRDSNGGIRGRLGGTLTVEDGQAAARLCAINIVAQLNAACGGDLSRVLRAVRVGGYVNVEPTFDQIPQVMNGCSDFLVAVFGETGAHSRSAIGVANLPMGFAVEADAIFAVAS